VVRLEVGPLTTDDGFRGLVTDTSDPYRPRVTEADALKPDEWDALQMGIDLVEVPETVVEALASLRRALGEEPAPIVVSDRRWKKASRLLRACAVAHGRAYVDGQDLGLLEHVLWDRPDQRPRVAELLVRTLEEEGWPGPVSLETLEAEAEALRLDLRALTLRERTLTRPKPVLQDGEYFTLLGYPGTLSARVWAQDFALLKTDEDLEGELFFFTPYGPFRHSEKHGLRATGGPAEVEVDGRLFALESRPEEVTVYDRIPPDGPGLKAWEALARDLMARVVQARAVVEAEAAEKKAEAALHLFCSAYAEACGRGLERDAADLGDLLVTLETLVETRDPD
jgi:hypothetical protein